VVGNPLATQTTKELNADNPRVAQAAQVPAPHRNAESASLAMRATFNLPGESRRE
jgi:hypothetical protein